MNVVFKIPQFEEKNISNTTKLSVFIISLSFAFFLFVISNYFLALLFVLLPVFFILISNKKPKNIDVIISKGLIQIGNEKINTDKILAFNIYQNEKLETILAIQTKSIWHNYFEIKIPYYESDDIEKILISSGVKKDNIKPPFYYEIYKMLNI